jgi:uncharacterized protein
MAYPFSQEEQVNLDPVVPCSPTTSEVEYDFSAVLAKAATIYEQRLGTDWLLFAPDWWGGPVVVTDLIHKLLNEFSTPSSVGEVLARFASCDGCPSSTLDLGFLTNVIAFLEDGGFLRCGSVEFPYPASAYTESPSPKSVEVWLHVTNMCNLDCAYCFVTKRPGSVMADSVCDATAKKLARTAIVNQIERVTVKYAGGEPTLVMPVVERFRAQLESELAGTAIRTHSALLSNGTHIDDRVLAFLARPDSSISISLDGCEEAHDFYRRTRDGSPTWARIIKNFDLLQRHGVKPFVMTTVTEATRHGLARFVRWVLSRGLKTRLSVVRELGMRERDEAECTASAMRMAASFEEVFALLERERIPFDPCQDLRICELNIGQPSFRVPCGIGLSHLVVKTDGKLTTCPMTVDDPGHPPGDDLLATCRSIFQFNPATARTGNDGAECLKCQWFPVCVGGCPVYNDKTRGQPFARSPLCAFYRAVIPRYLEFLGHRLQEQRDGEHKTTSKKEGATNAYQK